jgi:hypothetical protein
MVEFRPPLGKGPIVAIFVIFGIAAIVLVTATVGDGTQSPPVAFTVLWLAALGWNAYWWLFRIAVALRIDGYVLYWNAPFRSGAIPLADLKGIRPLRLASNVEVFDHSAGRPVLVMATKGLGAFLDAVSVARPDLPVRLGWQGRLAERTGGWPPWRRRDNR